MLKRRFALSVIAALLIGFWLGWFFKTARKTDQLQIDPVAKARDFALLNDPQSFSKSRNSLSFFIDDNADVWTVEVAPQGQLGGGLRLMVWKKDGRVALIGKTQ